MARVLAAFSHYMLHLARCWTQYFCPLLASRPGPVKPAARWLLLRIGSTVIDIATTYKKVSTFLDEWHANEGPLKNYKAILHAQGSTEVTVKGRDTGRAIFKCPEPSQYEIRNQSLSD
eukprot:170109-Pleurochrysis_carterae.AAC.1